MAQTSCVPCGCSSRSCTVSRHGLDSGWDVSDGFRGALPGGTPGPSRHRRRFLDGPHAGDQRHVSAVRGRYRARDVCRDSSQPGRLPGGEERAAAPWVARLRQAAKSRRSARLSELVEVCARRRLAAPARAELDDQGSRGSSGDSRHVRRRGSLRGVGREGSSDRSGMGVRRARWARSRRIRLGQRARRSTAS